MEFRIIAAFLLLTLMNFSDGSNTCEPVKAPMCESMPYKLTRMPNRFHHNTQENAVLAIGQFDALVNTQCSSVLRFFLCTMFVPICAESDSLEQQDMIPPCRSVCEQAREGCLPIMLRYNVTWPENLACENLPQHKEGVCVLPDAIIADPSSEPNKEISESGDKWRDRNSPRQRPRGRNPEERKGTKSEKKDERRRRKNDKQERKLQEKEERRQEKQERRQQRKQRRQDRGKGGQEEDEEDDDEKENDREGKNERNEKSDDDRKDERNEDGGSRKSKKEKKLKKKYAKESSVTEGSTPCVCQNPGQIKRQLKTQDFNFVVKVSWIGLERTSDGSSLMKFNLLDTLDVPEGMEVKKDEKITLTTNKTCICPRFKEDHQYLVAGYKNLDTDGLVVYEIALKWKPAMKMWMSKMKGKSGRKQKVDKRKERQRKKDSRDDHETRRGKEGKVGKGRGNRGRKGDRLDETDEKKFNKGDKKDQIATDDPMEDNNEDEETDEKTVKMTKKEKKRKKWEKKQERKGRKPKGQNGAKKRKLPKGRFLETTAVPLLEWTTSTAISTAVKKDETEEDKVQIDTEEDTEIPFEEEQENQKLGLTMEEEKGEENEPMPAVEEKPKTN